MPIYAFQCQACGHAFDRLQKISDPDPGVCPECGQPGVKRQLTAPAFRLAGSGWYETDFKKDGDKRRNLADAGDNGDKGDKGSGKDTASKPAGDAAAKAGAPAASKPAAKKD